MSVKGRTMIASVYALVKVDLIGVGDARAGPEADPLVWLVRSDEHCHSRHLQR